MKWSFYFSKKSVKKTLKDLKDPEIW